MKWLNVNDSKGSPLNWQSHSSRNLSCPTWLLVSGALYPNYHYTGHLVIYWNFCILAANGKSCPLKKMNQDVPRSTTHAFTVFFDDGNQMAAWMLFFVGSVLKLHQNDLLNISVIYGYGTTTSAKKGGDNIGYSGHKHMKGDKIVGFCDRYCNVIAPIVKAPGNRNESPLFREALPLVTEIAAP